MPLSNVISNRLHNLVNSINKEDVICDCQTKNATNLWLLGTRRNRVAGPFETEKRASKKNNVTGYFEIKKVATKKNRIVGHFKIEEEMEGANRNMFEVSFVYQRIIKYNW